MYRRTFLQSAATAAAPTAITRPASGVALAEFVDRFGFAVAHFFDDDWDRMGLKAAVEDTVDYACYAYGKFEQAKYSDSTELGESGYLSRLSELTDTSEAYDWALRNLEYVAHFVEHLDLFTEGIANRVDELVDDIRRGTNYVPLVWSVKGLLDAGCSIHDRLEQGEDISREPYFRLFKHVGLVVTEVVLLVLGVSPAYKTAFGATGWVNQRLINSVGRRIGWRAYSWVLSQIHWGVRVSFAESYGRAIDETVDAVAEAIVNASRDGDSQMSQGHARDIAESQITDIAEETDAWEVDYEIWAAKRRIAWIERKAERRVERLQNSLPF